MSRPLRVEFPGALYHVMSRGVDGMPTFRDSADWNLFLDRLESLVRLGVLIVHAFCLMTNHFHLLCETPYGELGRWMQLLLAKFSALFNRRHERVGHLWQARYKAILVEHGDYFLNCSAYIHLNPLKARLVEAPEEYPWSSCGTYFGCGERRQWVSVQKTLSLLLEGQDYRGFLDARLAGELIDPFKNAAAGIAFGSKTFAEDIVARAKQGTRHRLPGFACIPAPNLVPIERIQECVARVCDGLSECQKSRTLVYALQRYSGLTGRQLASLSGRSPQSVSEIVQSFEESRKCKVRELVLAIE